MAGHVDYQQATRVLAWLIRNEGVEPEAIERAVDSAADLRPGQQASLGGDALAPMRRAFVMEQLNRLDTR